jgi:hypothetical protein
MSGHQASARDLGSVTTDIDGIADDRVGTGFDPRDVVVPLVPAC